MIFTIIAAHTENRVIGKDNKLLWKLPEDMAAFKANTMGKIVLMGRRTFESIGRPLAGRYNVVITSNPTEFSNKYSADNLMFVNGFEEYFELIPLLSKAPEKYDETCIVGGAEIYKKALNFGIVDKMLLTIVHEKTNGDAYFPEINFDDWLLLKQNIREKTDPNSYLLNDPEKKPLKYSLYTFMKD
jgi:dihydrofolate reductase